MAALKLGRISMRPSFPQGPQFEDSALETRTPSPPGTPTPGAAQHGKLPARMSFSRPLFRRDSRDVRFQTFRDEEDLAEIPAKPPIPHALATAGDSTPLPILPLTVLSISMLGEFLSANVSTPFILFMVEGFNLEEGADPAYWTGILVSVFFITQFMTSLLWATVADKHGQRAVLFTSLLGTALTCTLFGTATTLGQAIVIRLLQGVFAGAIGVARGSVGAITDATNEGRAYAIMGFCWGLGGVAGAIVGGAFESPAKNWPTTFGRIALFQEYPYLLPCIVASSVTLSGALLSLFLAYDGGSRTGRIRLPLDDKIEEVDEQAISDDEPVPPGPSPPIPISSVVGQLQKKVSQKLSGYLAKRVRDASPEPVRETESPLPLSTSLPKPKGLPFSRTLSRTSTTGSAYGYRNRLGSIATLRRGSMASTQYRRRRDTDLTQAAGADGEELNFAQRLLMANELNATSLADLWVQAAINVDNENPFETDSDEESVRDEAEVERGAVPQSRRPSHRPAHRPSIASQHASPSPFRRTDSITQRFLPQATPGGRRLSSSSHLPAIFAHTGVRTPPSLATDLPNTATLEQYSDQLRTIAEDRPASTILPPVDVVTSPNEKARSAFSELPFPIILQFGLLALHSTTHDQIFYSYLVSKYRVGGLGLSPGHFSQLIAMMCLAQIAYQFYLYPNIGPPRGRFSHLAMFRIGSALYIPSYLSVILYRTFASEADDGNLLVMTGLALSTAIRYCGTTFSYTAVAILLNYMSPPHVVGLANGMAQSIVSLARFVGPVLGGWLWSISVQDDPSGYPFGFLVITCVCFFAILSSFLIR